MTAAQRGMFRCSVAAVLFGATTPFAARLVEETSAAVLAGLLYLGAAAAVLPIVGRRRVHVREVRRGVRRLAVAVLAGGFLGPLLLTSGLSRVPAATSSLLLNTELVATTVLAAVFFGEHRSANSVWSSTSVVPLISFSWRATRTPSAVITRSGSM